MPGAFEGNMSVTSMPGGLEGSPSHSKTYQYRRLRPLHVRCLGVGSAVCRSVLLCEDAEGRSALNFLGVARPQMGVDPQGRKRLVRLCAGSVGPPCVPRHAERPRLPSVTPGRRHAEGRRQHIMRRVAPGCAPRAAAREVVPTVLEIPSKEVPYDPRKDAIMQRVAFFMPSAMASLGIDMP